MNQICILWRARPTLPYGFTFLFIDREAGVKIIRLIASVCLSVCPWTLSRLNALTFDLDKFGSIHLSVRTGAEWSILVLGFCQVQQKVQ